MNWCTNVHTIWHFSSLWLWSDRVWSICDTDRSGNFLCGNTECHLIIGCLFSDIVSLRPVIHCSKDLLVSKQKRKARKTSTSKQRSWPSLLSSWWNLKAQTQVLSVSVGVPLPSRCWTKKDKEEFARGELYRKLQGCWIIAGNNSPWGPC